MPPMPKMMRVRIKPHDPKKGHTLRNLCHGPMGGKRFTEGKWYEVDEATAQELEQVNMDASITVQPLDSVKRAFDIFARDEADLVVQEELREAAGVPKAEDVLVPGDRSAAAKKVASSPAAAPRRTTSR